MERLAVRLTSTIWRTTLALFHPPGRFPVFSVLQNPKFRVLWYVGGLAEVARWMEMLVLSWLVLQATNSPFQLGLVLVFNNAPRPFFSLFAGLIADRFSRHLMLIIGQTVNMAAAAALLTLIVVDLVQPWHVFLIAFIQGSTRALEDPARRTGILDIVGERRLVNAMSLEVITNTTGKIIGPLIGGILIDTVAFTGAYSLLVAIHLLHWALLILKVRIPNLPKNTQQEPVWKGLGSAVGYALHSPTLISLLYITVVMNAMAFPVRQFIPVIGQDQLHVGATLVGLLVAAEGFGQAFSEKRFHATAIRQRANALGKVCIDVAVAGGRQRLSNTDRLFAEILGSWKDRRPIGRSKCCGTTALSRSAPGCGKGGLI